MLVFETAERDGHVILLAQDSDVLVDGKPYRDWTVVNLTTTTHMVAHNIEAARRRLTSRHERFLRNASNPLAAPVSHGRVVVGPTDYVDSVHAAAAGDADDCREGGGIIHDHRSFRPSAARTIGRRAR